MFGKYFLKTIISWENFSKKLPESDVVKIFFLGNWRTSQLSNFRKQMFANMQKQKFSSQPQSKPKTDELFAVKSNSILDIKTV